ncbi:MAG: type II toxin-antitoxin system mRNA interferase toxin, RelE/StbE family [Candidatus Magasanikbacteria bacterium]|nr:type II toxin-antitoxin system mRNA interferase toxin, RelE/StbE family [Candidatus Magasanikbacteria bacterium]
MFVRFSRSFSKQFDRAPSYIRGAFNGRLDLFIKNPFHPLLKNHKLNGTLEKYSSINITGDWRALFCEIEKGNGVRFEMLGTHSELYS